MTNKETVLAFFDAANRGDMNTCLGLLADELVWTDIGSTKFSGTYQGKERVLQDLIGPLFGQLKGGIVSELHTVIAEGDHVVVESSGRAETTAGVAYHNTYCQIFTVKAGLITAVVEYCDTALVDQVFGQRG